MPCPVLQNGQCEIDEFAEIAEFYDQRECLWYADREPMGANGKKSLVPFVYLPPIVPNGSAYGMTAKNNLAAAAANGEFSPIRFRLNEKT